MSVVDVAPASRGHLGSTTEPRGELILAMVRDTRGSTVLRERTQRFPLRTTVPFHLDERAPEMAFVYVQNPTGGVFGGDRLDIAVSAGPGTRVHLTTQSATKLYRSDTKPARQELRLELGEGAYVEQVPDALIPQAGADYTQVTSAELASGAMLVLAETIAPGRLAGGERFAYRRLVLNTRVRRGGEELFAETMRLEPGRRRPDRPGVLGDRDYLVTLTVLAPERDAGALATALDAELARLPDSRGAAGELPRGAGAFARVLAADAVEAEHALRRAWAVARRALLGLPLPELRK